LTDHFTATIYSRFAAIPLALLATTPALAVDGVIEINQTRALAGNVTPGDTPGFPVTLSRPGSYRLTGNLATSSRNISAIVVTADDVAVDLNGFTIACTLSTTGIIPVACQPGLGQGGQGVGFDMESRGRTSVKNGVVRGMGDDGIALGSHSTVQGVKSVANGGDGVSIGQNGRIDQCIASNNGGRGIRADFSGSVTNNIANENTLEGIGTRDHCVVTGNVATGNGKDGINAFGSVVTGNQANENGEDGIDVPNSGTVIGNRASFNGGFGLNLSTATGYAQNVVSTNNNVADPNDEVLNGIQMGPNICSGALCP
jgi:hypothetical protein